MSRKSITEFYMRSMKPAEDADFLFNLLKERDSRINISHKKMPVFSSHVKFIASKPYKKWYVVIAKKYTSKETKQKKSPSFTSTKIASVYLSKNDEIGIFVLKKFQRKKIGEFAISEVMNRNQRKRYLANVNPKNKKSIQFFKKNGFKLIQYTFEKRK